MTVTPINNQIDDAVLEFSVQHVVVDQLSNQLFPPTALTVRLTNDDIGMRCLVCVLCAPNHGC